MISKELSDDLDRCGGRLNSFFRVMKIFISEECVKAVAVDTDIVIADIAKKAVCCVSFQVFPDAFFLCQRAPLMRIMTGWTGDVAHIHFFAGPFIENR